MNNTPKPQLAPQVQNEDFDVVKKQRDQALWWCIFLIVTNVGMMIYNISLNEDYSNQLSKITKDIEVIAQKHPEIFTNK